MSLGWSIAAHQNHDNGRGSLRMYRHGCSVSSTYAAVVHRCMVWDRSSGLYGRGNAGRLYHKNWVLRRTLDFLGTEYRKSTGEHGGLHDSEGVGVIGNTVSYGEGPFSLGSRAGRLRGLTCAVEEPWKMCKETRDLESGCKSNPAIPKLWGSRSSRRLE